MTRRGSDLVSGEIEVRDERIFISVRWRAGDYIPDTSTVTLHLDTDQDPFSGHPGINSTGTVDTDLIGGDFLVVLGTPPAADGVVLYAHQSRRLDGISIWDETTLPCCSSVLVDGIDANFPVSLLGEDEGLLDFKAVSVVKSTGAGWSGWLDIMPDVGLAAARVEGH
jgi:hypothetical protein